MYLLGALLMAGLTFTACSDDDDSTVDNGLNADNLLGTYDLVAVNTQTPTDFDMNGTSNTNQMLETPCYNTSRITFSGIYDDFTFNNHRLSVQEQTGAYLCDDFTVVGTWERISGGYTNGTFRLTYVNGSGTTLTMDFIKEGNTLRYIDQYGPYPDRTSSGTATTTVGTMEYVFTKVQDN